MFEPTAAGSARAAGLLPFAKWGHANNREQIPKVNEFVNSFDWLAVKRNEAYPAFTTPRPTTRWRGPTTSAARSRVR